MPHGDDGWRIRRTSADLDRLGETESVFALANGWLGWRGTLDEGEPCGMPGSYLNGFHEQHELTYPESGYGFPERSDTVISAPNAALIRLWVDDEPLDLGTGTIRRHHQELDLRAGVVASLAGAWLVVAQGFGGLRDDRGVLAFEPRLPRPITRLAFHLRRHGHRLRVTLTGRQARYELPDAGPGDAVELWHHGEQLRVTGDGPVTRPMPPVPDPGPEPQAPPGRRPARRAQEAAGGDD
ncbi:glycosyl hydrolase family 65 protein [Micromonospora sp. WMMD1076]|uniref:glycosyl hydrolase family 65 protein n=1 Tax=Micromonospora sp. WMMD1076 TaxID=3016103 RepID=UPI00249AC469|nr:glycosyl hydrolase family 65 protein [Micromonospora sp. WMMD1076]WFF08022.1 glycosyl hydrolase family 65 protein [Micromonospora sp. WMMD1076]